MCHQNLTLRVGQTFSEVSKRLKNISFLNIKLRLLLHFLVSEEKRFEEQKFFFVVAIQTVHNLME